jgi:hypothetical protein
MGLFSSIASGWFSSREGAKNRAFQLHMARNKYQHMRYDLEKAGLNPILAISGGFSAGPGGASASPPSANINFEDTVTAKALADLKLVKEQERRLSEETQIAKHKKDQEEYKAEWAQDKLWLLRKAKKDAKKSAKEIREKQQAQATTAKTMRMPAYKRALQKSRNTSAKRSQSKKMRMLRGIIKKSRKYKRGWIYE